MYTITGILMNLRAPLRTVAMILLLSLGSAMLFLGYGLKNSADESERQATYAFTTLAVADTEAIQSEFNTSSSFIAKNAKKANYGVVRACAAYLPGYEIIHSTMDDVFYPSNNICALLITCKQAPSGQNDRIIFTVEKILSAHSYVIGRGLQDIECIFFREDLNSVNFEPDKQYIITGILNKIYSEPVIRINELFTRDERQAITYLPVTGNWQEILASSEGSKMRKWIEYAEISYQSLTVLATERLDFIVPFNQGLISIIEGRDMTPEEYINGDPVCLISSAFAAYHKLNIGDELPLQLYNTSFSSGPYNTTSYSWSMAGANSYSEIAEQENYTIVGIYYTKDFKEGLYSLNPNTIIIPRAAVSFTDFFSQPAIAEVLLIPNGKADAFLEEVDVGIYWTGASAMFTILDQGYSEVEAVLSNFARNANTSFLVSLVAWVILISAFILILILPSRKTAGMMRSVGASEIGVAKVIAAGGIAIVLVSVVLGVLAGSLLLDTAVEKAYLFGLSPGTETSVLFGQSGVPGSGVTLITTILNALAQFAVLCVVVCAASALTASQPVLKLLKVNRE